MSAERALSLVKLHGARNAFGLLDERPARVRDYAALARRICRSDGPLDGADGLLVVMDGAGAYARMRVFNADGSEAEMCGNGVRCVALYLAGEGAPAEYVLATEAGPVGVEIVTREPFEVRVEMNPVTFPNGAVEQTVVLDGVERTYHHVDVGNPHAVIFTDEAEGIDLDALGIAFNRLVRFPAGINVHVAQRCDDRTLSVRHYERGVGLTQACGTGAVACAAAAMLAHGFSSPVTVRVPGGTLHVDWVPGRRPLLRGPAERLFERTIAA